jgi:hypothetical protein
VNRPTPAVPQPTTLAAIGLGATLLVAGRRFVRRRCRRVIR